MLVLVVDGWAEMDRGTVTGHQLVPSSGCLGIASRTNSGRARPKRRRCRRTNR